RVYPPFVGETLSILQKILTKLQGLPQSDPYEFAGFSILLIFICKPIPCVLNGH
uniref:Uncharacterized protein n=1 Tax=Astyanax mexicanus TaxID=7994 RepID=A0A8B9H6F7_ASTMX